jgi:predicted acetyltransferase
MLRERDIFDKKLSRDRIARTYGSVEIYKQANADGWVKV